MKGHSNLLTNISRQVFTNTHTHLSEGKGQNFVRHELSLVRFELFHPRAERGLQGLPQSILAGILVLHNELFQALSMGLSLGVA